MTATRITKVFDMIAKRQPERAVEASYVPVPMVQSVEILSDRQKQLIFKRI